MLRVPLKIKLVWRWSVGSEFVFNILLQNDGIWKWSDGKPVGMQLWGFPYSLPKLTGNSCLVFNFTSQEDFPVQQFGEMSACSALAENSNVLHAKTPVPLFQKT